MFVLFVWSITGGGGGIYWGGAIIGDGIKGGGGIINGLINGNCGGSGFGGSKK